MGGYRTKDDSDVGHQAQYDASDLQAPERSRNPAIADVAPHGEMGDNPGASPTVATHSHRNPESDMVLQESAHW